VAESCSICSSRSRRPVRKLLDTPSYISSVETSQLYTRRTIQTTRSIGLMDQLHICFIAEPITQRPTYFLLTLLICSPYLTQFCPWHEGEKHEESILRSRLIIGLILSGETSSLQEGKKMQLNGTSQLSCLRIRQHTKYKDWASWSLTEKL
jgi:hypothetical protein